MCDSPEPRPSDPTFRSQPRRGEPRALRTAAGVRSRFVRVRDPTFDPPPFPFLFFLSDMKTPTLCKFLSFLSSDVLEYNVGELLLNVPNVCAS